MHRLPIVDFFYSERKFAKETKYVIDKNFYLLKSVEGIISSMLPQEKKSS